MFGRSGKINARERDWAQRMNEAGITVLMVDSLGPRHHGRQCHSHRTDCDRHPNVQAHQVALTADV